MDLLGDDSAACRTMVVSAQLGATATDVPACNAALRAEYSRDSQDGSQMSKAEGEPR